MSIPPLCLRLLGGMLCYLFVPLCTGLMLSQSGSKVTVSGRAVITSNGSAAGGILLISVREPGTTEWANVAVPDVSPRGVFTANIAPRLAPGTLVRAQVLKCKWCTGAKAYARVG